MESSVSVIETCWPAIEPFVDLEGSVSSAQTCTTLHRLIVDADSRLIKVSHFEVGNTPFYHDTLSFQEQEWRKKNWHTAPGRIPHFLSRALNAIFFPSLRSMSLDFPTTRRRFATGHEDIIDDASSSAFPIFVANIGHARNLEKLHVNVARLLVNERSGQMESLYEIFAQNLGRCHNLTDLSVINIGFVRGSPNPLYSVALVRAIARVIHKRRLGLERVKIHTAGQPSDSRYNTLLRSNGICAMTELLWAVFSASSLKELELLFMGFMSWQHWRALMKVAKSCRSSSGAMPELKRLMLGYEIYDSEPIPPEAHDEDATPVFEFFSQCQSLQDLWLGLSKGCLQEKEAISSLRTLLENKTKLAEVAISFGDAYDVTGDIVKVISETLASNIEGKTLSCLTLQLNGADEEDLSQLQTMLSTAGMVCCIFMAKRNGNRKLDVASMANYRPNSDGWEDAYLEFQATG